MNKKKLLVVGKNSFIANNFISNNFKSKLFDIIAISHERLPETFTNFDYVLNMAFNPVLYEKSYEEKYDYDLKILRVNQSDKKSKNIKNKTKFIFLSSRSVYGSSKNLVIFNEESAPVGNFSNYGYSKIAIENNIKKYLDPSEYIILRTSNILGTRFSGRNFIGIASEALVKNKKITLNVSKEVIRDFIPIDLHSKILSSLLVNNAYGIFNAGSGIGIRLEDICNALIRGFGEGLIEDSTQIQDQYILDLTKVKKFTGDHIITEEKILTYTYLIGKTLKRIDKS